MSDKPTAVESFLEGHPVLNELVMWGGFVLSLIFAGSTVAVIATAVTTGSFPSGIGPLAGAAVLFGVLSIVAYTVRRRS